MHSAEGGETARSHGYMLRSDTTPPEFLKKRLENMVEAERALAEREGKA